MKTDYQLGEFKNVKVLCTYEIDILGRSYTKNKIYNAKKYVNSSSYLFQGYSIMCNENIIFNFYKVDFDEYFIDIKKDRKEKLNKLSYNEK